jgi:hypothetical protein
MKRIIIAVLATFALASCTRGTTLPTATSDQPANFQLVTDIPIANGSVMDGDRSLILSDRDRWTGRVVMRINSSVTDLTAFYQSQMPAFGWQPVMSVTAEASVLTYTRSDRAATVQIDRQPVYGSTVAVTVAPRQGDSQAPAAAGYDAPSPRPSPTERVRAEPLAPPASRR